MLNVTRTSIYGWIGVFVFLLAGGCGANLQEAPPQTGAGDTAYDAADGVLSSGASEDPAAKAAKMAGREIIYTATVRLVADDFNTFPERLAEIALAADGFVGEADITKMQGTRRSGRWVIRVPSTNYSTFMRALTGLGVPESVQEKADDVTDKFVDLQARIKSGKQLEDQITKLLEKQSERLEDMLIVERELARVRLEIERYEGQLRFLESQVALSTITLFASEQTTFTPEQARTFSERIALEWQASMDRTRTTFENVVVWLVGNGLALVFWLIGLFLLWIFVVRRFWKTNS